ncbi:hypothetical protein [Companilactobacillus furfuricola]|uniref:hypothetical protein n=1 Tax=Companilactobacillus furfuricola TaxID=1462575 RepID=UPI0013DDFB51|nr:hypothetical protein [Companilactobacillus furfuricola]
MADLYCNNKLIIKGFKKGDKAHLKGLKAGTEQVIEIRQGQKVIHSSTFKTKG